MGEERKGIDNVFPCGGCLCGKCENNIVRAETGLGKPKEPCFYCEYCIKYGGKGKRKEKQNCSNFAITNYAAGKAREKFKVIRGGIEDGSNKGNKRNNISNYRRGI